VSDHTCQPYPKVGEACGDAGEGILYCDDSDCDTSAPTPTCRAVTLPSDGQPCRDRAPVCAKGHACNRDLGPPGICKAIHAKGGACATSYECEADLVCDLGVCKTKALPEAPCDSATLCHASSVCEGGTCKPLESQGQFESYCL
jgi:hypothetical protein